MLYYVKPLGVLEWTGHVGQDVIDIAQKNGLDLGLNTDWWERAARQATEDDVRVALRFGIPAAGGIVVAAGHIVTVHRPAELAEMAVRNTARTAAYRADPQTQAVEAWREQLAPGSKDASRVIDEGVADSLANAIQEAKMDASAELALPPAEELVTHWGNLPGARLPSPL